MVGQAAAEEQAALDAATSAVVGYLQGEPTDLDQLERFGRYHEAIYKLGVVYLAYIDRTKLDLGRALARQRVHETWDILCVDVPLLAAAVDAWLSPPAADAPSGPPLPDEAQSDDTFASLASQWLDEYIAWSQRWAPRAFADFHEACGLFVLSTIAARRVHLEFGQGAYTSLYQAMAGRTTLWTKTTTADLAVGLLKRAGLGPLLAPDDATPQAFVHELTGQVPEDYDSQPAEVQAAIRLRLAFAAQRGWFYEEFGGHVSAMMQREGVMAGFRSLLRRLDDHPEDYSSATIGRGVDRLVHPYVALLANITPADLQPYAKANSPLWRDGYFARFAFITPPSEGYRDDEFPRERLTYPLELLQPLQAWHQRLGVPLVTITTIGKPEARRYAVERSPLPVVTYRLADDVWQAFYRYNKALLALTSQAATPDLDGSYGRFPIKALRIAGLLASLEDPRQAHTIALPHWHRGQQIAERWRASLHRLVEQLGAQVTETHRAKVEGHIMRTLKKHGALTKRDLQRRTGIPALDLLKALDALREVGLIDTWVTSQTTKYRYAYETENGDSSHN
jgi:hypothetical protein